MDLYRQTQNDGLDQMQNNLRIYFAAYPAGEPTGELKAAIDKAFGSFDEFKKQFSQAGATQFGRCCPAEDMNVLVHVCREELQDISIRSSPKDVHREEADGRLPAIGELTKLTSLSLVTVAGPGLSRMAMALQSQNPPMLRILLGTVDKPLS